MQTITKNDNYKVIEEGWCWSKDDGYYNSDIYPIRNKAIEAAKKELGTNTPFYIIFCKVIEINIKDFVKSIVDKANEVTFDVLSTDEIFDDVIYDQKVDLDKMVAKTCDEWQEKYKLNFVHTIFDENTFQKINPITVITNKV